MTAPCRRRLLAESGSARIELCTCGHVHLITGPVTLRLSPEVLADMADTLSAAADALPEHRCYPMAPAAEA